MSYTVEASFSENSSGIAAVGVAEERLAAGRDPLDWPADAPRRPDDDGLLRVKLALHAEAAADIAGNDADAAFRHVQNLMRQRMADAVDVLGRGGEGPAAGAGIVLGKAAAWLHRHRGDAVVDEAEAGYVRSAGEGRLHRLDIAQAHRDCDVARDVLVHQRRAWRFRV